jgi:FixJ family two-component response regulator
VHGDWMAHLGKAAGLSEGSGRRNLAVDSLFQDAFVFLVDDNAGLCAALSDLLLSMGLRALSFGSSAEYLAFPKPEAPSCLVLDVGLPDINGLELQQRVADGYHPPIIFITGDADIRCSVRAIKAGAIDFLMKPFSTHDLMTAIAAAIQQDIRVRRELAEITRLQGRFASLTPREREVLPLVVGGLLNKQAAARLGISECTLQIHRGRVIHKMGADSVAQLVRMAGKLSVPLPHPGSF